MSYNPNILKNLITNPSIDLHILEKVDSTNDYLKKIKSNTNTACLSETQTHGKGRLQREWYSPYGENIYLSLKTSINKNISELSGFSMVIGLAICEAIENHLGLSKNTLQTKWPNDIVIDSQKLAGILIEIESQSKQACEIIIGMGINVNMATVPEKYITQAWTSLYKLTNKITDRNKLVANLINTVLNYILVFEKNSFKDFIVEWNQRDSLLNKTIKMQMGENQYSGIYTGINENGHLLLRDDSNHTKAFSSGEARLVKSG